MRETVDLDDLSRKSRIETEKKQQSAVDEGKREIKVYVQLKIQFCSQTVLESMFLLRKFCQNNVLFIKSVLQENCICVVKVIS